METMLDPQPARRAPRPDATVRVRLTRGCAERCLHCPDSARYRPTVTALALADVAAALAAAFTRFDPRRTQVIISGGEPADHPALVEALALVRTWPIARLKLATNGVRLAADPSFATSVLATGVDDLLLSVDLPSVPAVSALRSADHAAAVARLLPWLRARPARPRVALNTMIFDAPRARLEAQLHALLALGPDELRLLRFDPSELPVAALAAPSELTWQALRRWARRHNLARAVRVTCVDRQRNRHDRAARTLELA
jgi:molybdenum cofactor biosynthesis enzyme MoaA